MAASVHLAGGVVRTILQGGSTRVRRSHKARWRHNVVQRQRITHVTDNMHHFSMYKLFLCRRDVPLIARHLQYQGTIDPGVELSFEDRH